MRACSNHVRWVVLAWRLSGLVSNCARQVDVLVNVAGILSNNKCFETSADEWRKVHAVNCTRAPTHVACGLHCSDLPPLCPPHLLLRRVLRADDACFYLSKACMPHMVEQGWGRVINLSSWAWKSGGLTAGTAYSASKAAVVGLTFSLARQFAGDGVTVNAVAPCYVFSPMIMEQVGSDASTRHHPPAHR
jgi:3-oxoacyl-[acyl-carrier protein] reductase